MRVTVVGSGFVGQTTAMRLVERGLAEVVLIDCEEDRVLRAVLVGMLREADRS